MPLVAAYPQLVKDCTDCLEEAYKATFAWGSADYGDLLAKKFAMKGGPLLAQAIQSYVSQAQVIGTVAPGIGVQVAVPAGTGATITPGQIANGSLL